MPRQALVEQLTEQVGEDHSRALDAYHLAERLLGDSILSNMLMLGVAWQRGAIPLQLAAIERAIELNGVAVQANKLAFQVGREIGRASCRERVEAVVGGGERMGEGVERWREVDDS